MRNYRKLLLCFTCISLCGMRNHAAVHSKTQKYPSEDISIEHCKMLQFLYEKAPWPLQECISQYEFFCKVSKALQCRAAYHPIGDTHIVEVTFKVYHLNAFRNILYTLPRAAISLWSFLWCPQGSFSERFKKELQCVAKVVSCSSAIK